MSQNYDDMRSDDDKAAIGCVVISTFALLDLGASVATGILFGWLWGLAFYFLFWGLFGLLILISVALKGGAK